MLYQIAYLQCLCFIRNAFQLNVFVQFARIKWNNVSCIGCFSFCSSMLANSHSGIQLTGGNDLFQWWEKISEVCNRKSKAEIATICWAIWKAKNDLMLNKKELKQMLYWFRQKRTLCNGEIFKDVIRWLCFRIWLKVVELIFGSSHERIQSREVMFNEHHAFNFRMVARISTWSWCKKKQLPNKA